MQAEIPPEIAQVTYRNRLYRLLWYGRTDSGGLRARIGFLDTKHDFWVDADKINTRQGNLALVIEQEDRMRSEMKIASRAETADPSLIPTVIPLFPFQAAGVLFEEQVGNALNADEPGLGKTAQALGLLEKTNAYPALVVCPATPKLNWVRETKRFVGRTAVPLGGVWDTDIEQEPVTIVNYDLLTRHLDELMKIPWQAIVLDEAHAVKNPTAKRTQACHQLATLESLQHKLCLTGTPILNRPEELVEMLLFLGMLGQKKRDNAPLGPRWKFLERYCQAHAVKIGHGRRVWDTSGASNLEELGTRLRSTCMIRRLKSQVMAELPPVTSSLFPVELSNGVEYGRIKNEFRRWLADHVRQRPDLQGFSESELVEILLHLYSAETILRISAQRQAVGIGKIEAAKAFIQEFLSSGTKLVVFAYHREVQNALCAAFPEAARILGDDTVTQRQEAVDEFQGDANCNPIICSLKAAKEAITLTAASHVAIVEYDWVPSMHDQAIARCHRIGQQLDTPVNAWFLHAEGTFDDVMAERTTEKTNIITQVLA